MLYHDMIACKEGQLNDYFINKRQDQLLILKIKFIMELLFVTIMMDRALVHLFILYNIIAA